MKKKLVAFLAAVMVLGIAGISFAASNPFVDVPAKHWSYDSITELYQAGIIDGYADGKFQGDKVISRYEMAKMVATAMGRADKANASQKATIDKLAKEYATELEGLNVRVGNVEKRLSVLDKVTVSGAARIRYDHVKDAGVQGQNINMDINYSYKVNDDWSIKGESEWNRNLRNGGLNSSINDQFEQLYVTGPIGGATVKVGRFSYTPTYGLTFDNKVNGVQVSFGNVLKTTVSVGDNADDYEHEAIDFVLAYDNNTNIKANYQKLTSPAGIATKYYEVGFDTKFGNDFSVLAAYAKSDADKLNKSSFVQIQYKAADANVVGSSDVYVAYRKTDKNSNSSNSGDFFTAGINSFKGFRIGYDYVPMKNAKFTTWYQDGKTTDGSIVSTTASDNVKFTRAQVEFYF